jgi:threonine/homoserine/homoserine lactone efflux protein
VTISAYDMALYAGALFILFATPGPVWVALLARTLSGGFNAAWPLALGVVVGDVIWPLLAILGLAWIVGEVDGLMTMLRYVAAAIFLVMGVQLLRRRNWSLSTGGRLTRPGMWAGFAAGVAVILSNPKAILFYIGVLPGFFDLGLVTRWDITVICLLSLFVPLVGNLALAAFVVHVRSLLTSTTALRRLGHTSGILLIVVGLVIAIG